MRKILGALTALTIAASSSAGVVSCQNNTTNDLSMMAFTKADNLDKVNANLADGHYSVKGEDKPVMMKEYLAGQTKAEWFATRNGPAESLTGEGHDVVLQAIGVTIIAQALFLDMNLNKDASLINKIVETELSLYWVNDEDAVEQKTQLTTGHSYQFQVKAHKNAEDVVGISKIFTLKF